MAEVCEVRVHTCMCVNVCLIIMGVGAEHFLRGKCGKREISKRLVASFPGVILFLTIDQRVCATMKSSE